MYLIVIYVDLGSRPSLKVRGQTFPDGDAHRKFPFTKFRITYNGFVDWAGDFMLAVCRKDICQFSRNNGSISSELEYIENGKLLTTNDTSCKYMYIIIERCVGIMCITKWTLYCTHIFFNYTFPEPSHRQYFPMAHQQAKWNDLIVNGTDVKSVYVFQAHSLSYSWFPYATGEIAWGSLDDKGISDSKTVSSHSNSSNSGMRETSGHYFLHFIFVANLYFAMSIRMWQILIAYVQQKF